MAEISLSTSEDMATFYVILKLYVFALNTFLRKIRNKQAENLSQHVTDAQICIRKWIQKHSFGYDETFGGKNGDKIKNEIDVSYCVIYMYVVLYIQYHLNVMLQ